MSTMDTIKSVINVVGDTANTLTDASIKQFYSLRDFYNFIRKEENCPMAHGNFFTIVPEYKVTGLLSKSWSEIGSTLLSKVTGGLLGGSNNNSTGDTAEDKFEFDQYNLGRFALAAQAISQLTFTAGTTQTITSPHGDYSYFKSIKESRIGGPANTNKTFTITFLEMAQPIIQSFIIPWMVHLQHNTLDTIDKNSKLNFVVKFYRADQICGMDFLMNPAFIYRITGVFPASVKLVTAKHGPSNEIGNRTVTFAYDNLMVFSNAQYEKFIRGDKYNFAYENLSPVQILNKLNYQASNIATLYNQAKNIF